MSGCLMTFPEDWHEFLKDYSFDDSQEVYTNGSRLIPVFRVEQLIEYLLKAQETRVMTLEEAQGEDYCWYESRVANICVLCDATMYPNPNGKPKTELQQMGTWMRGWQYDDEYGKTWRCWTFRPDEKRRAETPWES